MTKMPTNLKKANLLKEVRKQLKELYKERIRAIILFGSHARGEGRDDSDIDIALVLEGRVERISDMDKIRDRIYELELESGELICVYPISVEEYESSNWPLIHHIRNEGIKI